MSGLTHVFPDMTEVEKRTLCKNISENIARSMGEMLMNESYRDRVKLFRISGPGLDVIRQSYKEGKGILLVSGHFGQWEAVRHYLRSEGIEVGAIYRRNNNPWFDKLFSHNLAVGGTPMLEKSNRGNLQMIKYLRKGGIFAILVDQKHQHGEKLKFLGKDALTTTAPAQMALRYDLPIVPCFGIRNPDKFHIDIECEAPIPHTDILTMTQEINNRISAQIMKHPEQWYWLHKRWNDLHLYDELRAGDSK